MLREGRVRSLSSAVLELCSSRLELGKVPQIPQALHRRFKLVRKFPLWGRENNPGAHATRRSFPSEDSGWPYT